MQLVRRITEIEVACGRSDWETAAILVTAATEAGFADPSLDAFRQRIDAGRTPEAPVVSAEATAISDRFAVVGREESPGVPGAPAAVAAVQSGSHAAIAAASPVDGPPPAAGNNDVAERDSARVQAAIRNARSRAANGKHGAALKLLQDLDISDPAVAGAIADIQVAQGRLDDERRTAAAAPAPPSTLEKTGVHRQITLAELDEASSVDPPTAIFPALTGNGTAGTSAPPIPRLLPPPLPPQIPRDVPPRLTTTPLSTDATMIMRRSQPAKSAAGSKGNYIWLLVAAAVVAVALASLALLLHL